VTSLSEPAIQGQCQAGFRANVKLDSGPMSSWIQGQCQAIQGSSDSGPMSSWIQGQCQAGFRATVKLAGPRPLRETRESPPERPDLEGPHTQKAWSLDPRRRPGQPERGCTHRETPPGQDLDGQQTQTALSASTLRLYAGVDDGESRLAGATSSTLTYPRARSRGAAHTEGLVHAHDARGAGVDPGRPARGPQAPHRD
jgi:hypothetical protein